MQGQLFEFKSDFLNATANAVEDLDVEEAAIMVDSGNETDTLFRHLAGRKYITFELSPSMIFLMSPYKTHICYSKNA